MSLTIGMNDFCKFLGANKAKIDLVGRKWTQKYATFGQVDTHVLAILGFNKVDFSTFSKLFWTCLGSVWALFSASKGLLLGVF